MLAYNSRCRKAFHQTLSLAFFVYYFYVCNDSPGTT